MGPSGYIYTRYRVGEHAPAVLLDRHYALDHFQAYGRR